MALLLLGLAAALTAWAPGAFRFGGSGSRSALAQAPAPLAHYWYSIGMSDPLETFGDISGVAGSQIFNHSYAVDRANHRLLRFDTRGEIAWVRGGFGSGEGQLSAPGELDTDGEDRVFVIDKGNDRIQVFDSDGRYLDSWGSRGTGDGQFIDPVDIAVSRSGTVYLLDRALGRVQRLRDNGDIISSFGTSGEAQLDRPSGIAVAPDGLIWVADTGNNRILRLSSRGTVVGSWDGFQSPVEVAVGANSDVYVIEALAGNVKRFDENMSLLGSWGGGEFGRPISIGVTEGNIVYVADAGKNRLERYTSSGEFETLWGGQNTIDGEFDSPVGLSVSPNGTLYVLDDFHQRVSRYSLAGAWRDSFASEGSEAGQLRRPKGIAASPDSTVYIADTGNDRVQRLSAAGSSPAAWGEPGEEPGQMERPSDLAVTPAEASEAPRVFVADTGNNRIQRFDRTGGFEASWGTRGPVEGTFRGPMGIAVSPQGEVWVSDTENHRLQAFDLDGKFLRAAGSQGSAPGELESPLGLEASADRVFVADSGNARVQVFDAASAAALGSIGAPVAGAPGLAAPRDVTLGSDDRILVADTDNRRILVYSPELPEGWRLSFYDSPAMTGHAARLDESATIDFNWADGRPGPGVPADAFGLRAEGYLSAAEPGVHALALRAQGRVRAWVGGRLLIDEWEARSVDTEVSFDAAAGAFYTLIEYQDPGGAASLSLDWRPNGGSLPTRTPRPRTPTPPAPTRVPNGDFQIHLPLCMRAEGLR